MANITLPSEVGVHVVGARPDQPQFYQPSPFTGEVDPINAGHLWLKGACQLIERSKATGGLSQVLGFLMQLQGAINTFDLPLPDRLTPWAAAASTAAAAATAAGAGTVTLAALPTPTPVVGQFVRINNRVVRIGGISGMVLTVAPALTFAIGASVQWGTHSVRAYMEGEPSNLTYDSRTGFVSRVTINWIEKV